jgi:hypothetical protein
MVEKRSCDDKKKVLEAGYFFPVKFKPPQNNPPPGPFLHLRVAAMMCTQDVLKSPANVQNMMEEQVDSE